MGRHSRDLTPAEFAADESADAMADGVNEEGAVDEAGRETAPPFAPLASVAAPEPAGPFAATPWSGSVTREADGRLALAGVPLTDLAAQHGTPVYLLDEADMRGRARALREAFEGAFTAEAGLAGVDVYYAGKAFLSIAVARWMAEDGLFVDTSTAGELAVALRAGVPGPRIGLHGNNKSDAELETALRAGIGRIVVDSLAEIPRLAVIAQRLGVVAPVMVRVTTGVHAGGHAHIATAHEDQKFGLSLTAGTAREAVDLVLADERLHWVGLHGHIGSQILDLAAFSEAADRLMGLRAQIARETGRHADEVDLGGGYGIAYTALDGAPPAPAQIAGALAQAVRAACARHDVPAPRISIEPGRAIAGPSTLTLYTVGTVKDVALGEGLSRRYVSVDGGMSDNLRPALYGADYTAALANRAQSDSGASEAVVTDAMVTEASEPGAAMVASRVVGKHCESGDIVVHDVALPSDVRAGDLLAVPATGAYGRAMASNYNMMPRPPVVAVRGGTSRVLVRRETVEDLLALDEG